MPWKRRYPSSFRAMAPFFCSIQACSFLRYGRERVSSIPWLRQYSIKLSFTNSLALSTSRARSAQGKPMRIRSSARDDIDHQRARSSEIPAIGQRLGSSVQNGLEVADASITMESDHIRVLGTSRQRSSRGA